MSGKREVQAMERVRKAIAFRSAGMSLAEIADRVGYSDATAVSRAINRFRETIPQEEADELRYLLNTRLDYLLSKTWLGVVNGKVAGTDDDGEVIIEPDLGAINTARSLLADMARLNGLTDTARPGVNVAVGVNVSTGDPSILVIDGDTDAYKAGLAKMAGFNGVPPEVTSLPELPPANGNGSNGNGNGAAPKKTRRPRKAAPSPIETSAVEVDEVTGPCSRYTRPRGSQPGADCRCGFPKGEH